MPVEAVSEAVSEAASCPATSSALPSATVSASRDPDTASPIPSSPSPNSTRKLFSSSRTSLLPRLGLPLSVPLRSRNRNVVDFHVRCQEPHRKYSAGDSVRGSVVLAIVRPLRITHLVVCLHGHMRVAKDPTSAAKAQLAATLPPGGSSILPQYHGNGLVSLFQDEQVLSGEGRLEPGKYEFGFDLVFPEAELPSSIDFERGTISYLVTATLTRPTTMAPTSSCERKVMLSHKIDIGLLAPPHPRTIFLEPISKRARRKKTTTATLERVPTATSPVEANDASSEPESTERPAIVDDSSRDAPADQRSRIPSDLRSEVSGESGRSASTAVSKVDGAPSAQAGTPMTSAAKQQVVDNKTITATIELLRGACLPGDTVSARVTVQHIKRVKSMTGVIVTLFRQGKIDTSPPISRFTAVDKDEAKKMDKEEMYPRSRTSLGGLSLSSTSSTSIFRKDLDQNAAPLIIDPATLQASVTISVKIPDDAFPTIKGVPGDMISFKYQVEVVVDLGGRLTSQPQRGSSSSRLGPYSNGGSEQGTNSYGPRRSTNIADTAQLRREKGVISVSMEMVGTLDSSRGRKPMRNPSQSKTVRMLESDGEDDELIRPDTTSLSGASPGQLQASGLPANAQSEQQANDYRFAPPPGHPPTAPSRAFHPDGGPSQGMAAETNGLPTDATPSYVPAPQFADQQKVTEKERLRQAEIRLLPSQPPAAGPRAAEAAGLPVGGGGLLPAEARPSVSADEEGRADASAPTEDQVSAGGPATDKQEAERLRLMNEASAPPDFPEDAEPRSGGQASREHADYGEPSAPVLDFDDFAGLGAAASGPSRDGDVGQTSEQLPAYER